jgi:hypothetical protein
MTRNARSPLRSLIGVFSPTEGFRGDVAVRCEAGDETGQEWRSVAC